MANTMWLKVVFVDCQYNEFTSPKNNREFKTYKLNIRTYKGEELSRNGVTDYVNVDEEKEEVKLGRVLTQLLIASKKPELFKEFKEAIVNDDNDSKKDILDMWEENRLRFGEKAEEMGFEDFGEFVNEELGGFQFKLCWQKRQITGTQRTQNARPASVQMVIYPLKQKETIKGKTIEDFIEQNQMESIESQTKDAVAMLDNDDMDDMDEEDFESETTPPKSKSKSKKKKKKKKGKKDDLDYSF